MARKIRRLPQFPEPGPPLRGTPEWRDMFLQDAGTDAVRIRNGTPYPPERLEALGNYLARRGVTLSLGDGPEGPGNYFWIGPRDPENPEAPPPLYLVLRENPTCYAVWHELIHYLHFRRIGEEAYRALRRERGVFHEAEQVVFDFLNGNRKRWEALSDEERWHAMEYVDAQDAEYVLGFR